MSNSMTRHVILNSINAPLKILIWTKGELGAFILPALLGVMFRQMFAGAVSIYFFESIPEVYPTKI